jgi:hypothetical protein
LHNVRQLPYVQFAIAARAELPQDRRGVDYRAIHNNCSRQALMWLLMAQNIFNRQLTSMPEHYITRLFFPSNRYVTSADWKAKGAAWYSLGTMHLSRRLE